MGGIRGLSSTDDLFERPKAKLVGIKGFIQRNAKRFLVAGVFAVILSVLALFSGIGFAATVNITSSQVIVRGHPCGVPPIPDCALATSSCYCVLGWTYEGVMNVTFSPYLYPVNHLFGGEVSANFTLFRKPSVSETSMKESIVTQTLLSEFPINIPLFYAIGLITATGLEKAIIKGLRL